MKNLLVINGRAVSVGGAALLTDDLRLPEGYRELVGIAFDGNFHYESSFRLKGTDTLRFSYQATAAGNVLGCYCGNTTDPNFSFYHTNVSAGSYVRYSTNLMRPKVNNSQRYDIVMGPTGAEGFASSVSWTPASFTVAGDFFIGMLDNSTSAALKGNIYGRVRIDNRADFVPVESAGGVIGYYEMYTQTFLTKTGSGTPVSLGYLE